jgi:outer membrane protein assembly factor BamA
VLPGGWRLDAFLGREQHVATPFYGIGNATVVDPTREDDPANPYYYRFGRTRWQAAVNLQRPLGQLPLRLLAGGAVTHTEIDLVPFDSGTTLLAERLGTPGQAASHGGFANSVRAGMVWDTRDREVGTRRGSWSEVLVQPVIRLLGSDHAYVRWTLTDRRYVPLGDQRLVFANRVLLQGVEGDAPVWELSAVQTSFKPQEGLGGAKTLRGLPKNRYVGRGLFLWNAEVRWRAAEFEALGKPVHAVLSGFVDSGRVWEERVRFDELASDLHHGFGGGLRLGMGENFVVAVDIGHSKQAAAPFYIGLGYLY